MTLEICSVRLDAGRRQVGLGHVDMALAGHLQQELVADLGLEVVGREGGRGGRVVPGVLARAGTDDGRQLLAPLRRQVRPRS